MAMFFSGISVWCACFDLRHPFSHNLADRRRAMSVIVKLTAGNGVAGYGQAIPRKYLTGESLDSVIHDIRSTWWPELQRLDIPDAADLLGILRTMSPLFQKADAERLNASYAAVEIAALGAVAETGRLRAGARGRAGDGAVPLVGVISAGGAGRAAWTARALRWIGYRHFKVKVGRDEEGDGRRLAAVRKVIGPECWLAVDANQAWGWDDAVRRMSGLRTFGVRVVEEPLTADTASSADFRELEKLSGVPIMADETLCTLSDAEKLLRRGSPSWWNLRLAKNGGFSGVSALAALAREHSINIYQGVLVGETSLLAAAGRVAMFSIGPEMAEYGFPRYFLAGDPFRGGPGGFRGRMTPPPAGSHGFGVRLVEGKLAGNARLVWRAEA